MDLSGLRGVGNTSIAVEYLHHHHADYPDDVFGCAVGPETTLVDDHADLAWLEGLNLNERAEPDLERAVPATTRLLAHPPWLLASGG